MYHVYMIHVCDIFSCFCLHPCAMMQRLMIKYTTGAFGANYNHTAGPQCTNCTNFERIYLWIPQGSEIVFPSYWGCPSAGENFLLSMHCTRMSMRYFISLDSNFSVECLVLTHLPSRVLLWNNALLVSFFCFYPPLYFTISVHCVV